MKRQILTLVTLAMLPFMLIACTTKEATSAKEGVSEGDKATDFTLQDLSGNKISLSEFHGRYPVLLVFTTTWCPHCVTIIPQIKQIYSEEEYNQKRIKVIAVYLNESMDSVKKFAQQHKIDYTVLVDAGGSVGRLYNIAGVPTLMVVDKTGFILYKGYTIPKVVIAQVVR